MSAFSDFIRNATPKEKEAVYMDVMKRATERQMSDTPRTDAEERSHEDSSLTYVSASFARQLERELSMLRPEARALPEKPTPEMLAAGGDAFDYAARTMIVPELQAGYVYDAMVRACGHQPGAKMNEIRLPPQPSYDKAMKRFEIEVSARADLDPPLTQAEMRFILDACLTGGVIFLRCKFDKDEPPQLSLPPDCQHLWQEEPPSHCVKCGAVSSPQER